MTSWRYRDSRWSERLNPRVDWNSKLTLVAVVAAVLVIVGAAVIIARGDSAEKIAEDAHILTWSESVASATTALRAEVREALVVGQSASAGVLDDEATAESAARIREAIAALEDRVDLLPGISQTSGISDAANVAGAQAAAVADAIEAGNVAEAAIVAADQLGPTFEELLARATAVSQESAEDIAAVNAGLGTVTTAARFVTALLIPALVVFLFYRALRRSQKLSLLRTELARERELRRNKDEFVAAASLHVRTPVSAIVGLTELLRDDSGDFSPAVREEVIGLIASEAEETANVVDDLFAAARYEVGDFEPAEARLLEVRDVIDAVTSDWADTRPTNLTIRGNAVVLGDERWLSQAIRNLLRTASSSGGEQVEVAIDTAENQVAIQISDNGAAIPAEENDRISELYYSYSEVDGLTPPLGLGLAVARRIAKASGGDLRYERLEGKNVWQMTLPSHESHVLPRDTINRVIDPTAGMPTAGEIERVIAGGGPPVEYQCIVAMTPGRPGDTDVIGYEALARFDSHAATDWFVAASRLGLRVDLELVCIQAAIAGFHPMAEGAFLAVNVSDETVHDSQLAQVIADMAPSQLVLELSDTAAIASYQRTREALGELAATGIWVAIDDVGSGELNLEHLARLEARIIKIDTSLVREASSSSRIRGLIKAIVAMADELGAFVVAVGVETNEEHDTLTGLGVPFGQGNLYAHPANLALPAPQHTG
jgi:EAL domain-containing protein (putative c-di-GMP-specific phosphodiesterase class I)/signal transduction histidine kinase